MHRNNRRISRTPPRAHICWHCGARGHMVGVCPVYKAGEGQTPEGMRAYGRYCADTGLTRSYDAASIIRKYKDRLESRSRSRTPSIGRSSASEMSDMSEAEVTVISDDDESSSSRAVSPAAPSARHKSNIKKKANTMKVVYSMLSRNTDNIDIPKNISEEEKQELLQCLKNENNGCDSLGLPISINNIDAGLGLIDQGASSAIISRSLMNQMNLKVKEYKVYNHCVITSSGEEKP